MGKRQAIKNIKRVSCPDEERIVCFKGLMKKEDYIRISPELAVKAKKFRLPRYALQKGGEVSYIHDIQTREKNPLYLMKRDWLKMLDILTNKKTVYCTRELLVAMKMEAKAEASGAKAEKDAEVFYSIDSKLSCFLEEMDIHNLSHILKGQTKAWTLPESAAGSRHPQILPFGCNPPGRVGGVKDFRLGLKYLTPHAFPGTLAGSGVFGRGEKRQGAVKKEKSCFEWRKNQIVWRKGRKI